MREPTGIVDGPSLRPLIRPCGPPSPQGEGPAGGRAKTSLEKGGGICEANAGGFLVSCLQKPPVTAYRRRQPPLTRGAWTGGPKASPFGGGAPVRTLGRKGPYGIGAPSVGFADSSPTGGAKRRAATGRPYDSAPGRRALHGSHHSHGAMSSSPLGPVRTPAPTARTARCCTVGAAAFGGPKPSPLGEGAERSEADEALRR